MRVFRLLFLVGWPWFATFANAEKVTIAAAADLKFAMDEMVIAFKSMNPGADVDVVYGSSGNFYTQLKQGAPYDLFFSADIAYPRDLVNSGLAASEVKPYAFGSSYFGARAWTLRG
jgi:molybdate transport system substrate-binding protein